MDFAELEHVADGQAVSAAFERIASRNLDDNESATDLRGALLKYCELDTLVMLEVHQASILFLIK